jgi:hypothetical protein
VLAAFNDEFHGFRNDDVLRSLQDIPVEVAHSPEPFISVDFHSMSSPRGSVDASRNPSSNPRNHASPASSLYGLVAGGALPRNVSKSRPAECPSLYALLVSISGAVP